MLTSPAIGMLPKRKIGGGMKRTQKRMSVVAETNPAELLLECFEMFDQEKTGKIQESVFVRILTRKSGKKVKELDDMLAAYKKIHCKSNPETPVGEEYIDYKAFIKMLEN